MTKKKNIESLIEKGKRKKYLTFQEIENYLGDEKVKTDKIEDLYDTLNRSGVEVIDEKETVDGKEKSKKTALESVSKKRITF